jgi:hypothetical protein
MSTKLDKKVEELIENGLWQIEDLDLPDELMGILEEAIETWAGWEEIAANELFVDSYDHAEYLADMKREVLLDT